MPGSELVQNDKNAIQLCIVSPKKQTITDHNEILQVS